MEDLEQEVANLKEIAQNLLRSNSLIHPKENPQSSGIGSQRTGIVKMII